MEFNRQSSNQHIGTKMIFKGYRKNGRQYNYNLHNICKSKKFKLGTFAQSVTASFGLANPFSPISSKANAKQLSLELH